MSNASFAVRRSDTENRWLTCHAIISYTSTVVHFSGKTDSIMKNVEKKLNLKEPKHD